MGGDVFVVFEPGKFGTVAHCKHFGHETVQRADTDSALDGLAVENNDITQLMTKMTGSLLAENSDFDTISSVVKFTAFFRTHGITSTNNGLESWQA